MYIPSRRRHRRNGMLNIIYHYTVKIGIEIFPSMSLPSFLPFVFLFVVRCVWCEGGGRWGGIRREMPLFLQPALPCPLPAPAFFFSACPSPRRFLLLCPSSRSPALPPVQACPGLPPSSSFPSHAKACSVSQPAKAVRQSHGRRGRPGG